MKKLFVGILALAAVMVLFFSPAVSADEDIPQPAPVSAEETPDAAADDLPAASLSTVTPRISIADATVTGIKDRIYTGSKIIPVIKVYIKSGGEKILLREGTDYEVLTSHTTNVGTAYVTVKGIGSYKGSVKRTFQITPARIRAASLKYPAMRYTGEARTQTSYMIVKARVNKQPVTLTLKKDYTVSYKNNVNVGTATVIITGTGNYTGTLEKTFKIVPRTTRISNIIYGPGRISVRWEKQNVQTTGYQLQCSSDKSFINIVKTHTIRDNSRISKTVSGLTAGKAYYLRIRTYKTVGEKRYYSAWSSVKKAVLLNNIRVFGSGSTRSIRVYNPKSTYQSMKAAVWSDEGGQDDLKWYPLALKDGVWSVSVPLAALKHNGSCTVHLYNGRNNFGSTSFECTLENAVIHWNTAWEFADYSAVHTGQALLYRASSNRKGIIVGVNAGHGTADYVHYVYSHPDHSPKATGGSTAAGSIYTQCDNYGMCFNDGVAEADAALRQAEILRDLLLDNGYDVLMVRTDNACGLDVIARTVMCNNLADCHISLHWDGEDFWYDKGCFYTSVPDGIKNMYPTSTIWQEDNALGESIINGLRSQGLGIFESGAMETDLMQTSYSSIPSIDLELGNQCSPHDDGRLYTNACGILAGLNAYFSR